VVTPIRLYPLYCTLYTLILHAGFNKRTSLSLSQFRQFVRLYRISQCTAHRLQFLFFLKRFRSDSASKSTNNSILLETGRSYHSTLFLNFVAPIRFPNSHTAVPLNCADSAVQLYRPWAIPAFSLAQVVLTLFARTKLCVSFPDLQNSFLCKVSPYTSFFFNPVRSF
jgi:hypothetical protein